MPLPVYRAEREAGLAGALSAAALSYASLARPAALDLPAPVRERVLALAAERALASRGDEDLYPLDTVLVSTGWNNNDDVFDPLEVWSARHTPEDKPFNLEHDCSNIIGHITGNRVVGGDGGDVPEQGDPDDLPEKFHVLTAAVLYKVWARPELQERMDGLLAGIARGEWYVSMEALFKGFDYALLGDDGTSRVVARNRETAFLTKHLRAYGGSGRYGEYRVGRLLRNLLFSGKGLVKKPANPESVILPGKAEASFSPANASLLTDFSHLRAGRVYSQPGGVPPESETESKQDMAAEIEKALAEARAENEKLRAELSQKDVGQYKARAEAAEAGEAKADEALKAAQAACQESEKKASALQAGLDEANKSLADVRAELSGVYADQKKSARLARAKEAMKNDEAAASYVEATAALSDEQFATAMTAWVSSNPQSGNTDFGGAPPGEQPKSTPAPGQPKSTPAQAQPRATGSEADPEGERAAAGADLGKAEGVESPSLSAGEPDPGVSAVQAAIASFLGADVGDESGE